jgi:hypothetical protein
MAFDRWASTTIRCVVLSLVATNSPGRAGAQPPPTPPPPQAEQQKEWSKKYLEALAIPSPHEVVRPDTNPRPEDVDFLLWGLLDRRYSTAGTLLNTRAQAFQAGATKGITEAAVDDMKRWTEAELALCAVVVRQKPECFVNAYERAVKFSEAFEEVTVIRNKAGAVGQYELDLIRYHRLSMQIKLLEAKKELKAKAK